LVRYGYVPRIPLRLFFDGRAWQTRLRLRVWMVLSRFVIPSFAEVLPHGPSSFWGSRIGAQVRLGLEPRFPRKYKAPVPHRDAWSDFALSPRSC